MTPDTDKREGLGEGIYAKFVQNYEKLLEENKKLKSDLAFERTMLDNVRAEYKSSQNVIKKLEERIDELEKCNLNLQEWLDRKEEVNKKLREELSAYDREYFDENKKANTIFMEEDTLQELRDLGEI